MKRLKINDVIMTKSKNKNIKKILLLLLTATLVLTPITGNIAFASVKHCTNNNNHSMFCGSSGKWFKSRDDIDDYYYAITEKWGDKFLNEEITGEEYAKYRPGGYESWSCAYCGKWTCNLEETDLNGKVTQHHWNPDSIKIIDSTCTKEGSVTVTCSACGKKDTTKRAKKEHHFAYKPNGNHTHIKYCENCGYNQVESCDLLQENDVDPTCASEGYTPFRCYLCNAVYKKNIIEKLPHKLDYSYNGNDTHTVTCANCEYKQVEPCEYVKDEYFVECTKCGEKHANDCVHEWDSGQITQESTCAKEGIKTFTCRICQATKTEEMERKPHSFVYSYDMMDWHEITCENCNYSDYEACDFYADGKYVECTKCGERHETDCAAYLNSGSHFWGNEYYGYDFSEIIKESTCTENGIKLYHCGLCGAKKAEELDKKPHTYELTTVQPTCTNDGYIANSCIYCGELYIDDNYKKIPAQGHDFGEVVYAKEPTYFEDGNIEYKVCKKCGKNFHTNADTFAADDTAIADVTIPRLVNLGDVNVDGKINALDVLIVKRFIAKYDDAKLEGDKFALADVSGDGKVNAKDALAIMQKIAKLIDDFNEIK